MSIGQYAGAAAGAALILVTAASVARTLVIPRGGFGRLVAAVDAAVHGVFLVLTAPISGYQRRDRALAAEAATIFAAVLLTWMALLLAGFALVLWPAEPDLGAAFRESGSALFTLGFASRGRPADTVVDFFAAFGGLVVIALQIAYLPTLYGAYNRRETEVTLLTTRAGEPAWGPELLARTRIGTLSDDLPAFYSTWERWAADVAESHTNYPLLLRFRSPAALASWLVGLLAVMDSAALYLALAPARAPFQARLCLRMGFVCLRSIAKTIGIRVDEDPRPDEPLALSREEFLAGVARITAVGFPVERSAEDAWPDFAGWRVNYESAAYSLAYALDATPAPWSGARRRGSPQLAPRRPVNRTPEDPEGTRNVPLPLRQSAEPPPTPSPKR